MGKKLTKKEFIERARKIHGDKYDYSKTEYINNSTKVKIICPIHGEFEQSPTSHIDRGSGCLICGGKKKLNTDDFISKARNIHGNKYDYSKVEYINNRIKVEIICPKHGEFEQSPSHHLDGQDCRKCMKYKLRSKFQLTKEQFIEKAEEIHGNLYDYSQVEYVNAHNKVIIICSKHGKFIQEPNSHIHGNGCPKCACSGRSAMADDWLDSVNINSREVRIKTTNDNIYCVDGLDKFNNVVYEFLGDFWHGNPKIYKLTDINPVNKIAFGELYNRTIDKVSTLILDGYDVVYKWETDYDMGIGIKYEE